MEVKERKTAISRQRRQWALEAAAARARKLAGKIDDPELLIFGVSIYLRLEPGVWTSAEPIHELIKGKTRRVKNHCTAVRRVLGIRQRNFHREMRLPLNWRARLAVVGLEGALLVDQSVSGCPDLIERTRAFLRGETRPEPEPRGKPSKRAAHAGVRSSHATLHEAMANKSDADQDDYDLEDEGVDQDNDPEVQAWSRAEWLKGRIDAFLRDKEL